MTAINPIILLCLGGAFALVYALIYLACLLTTRRARKAAIKASGISNLFKNSRCSSLSSFSLPESGTLLTGNTFISSEGNVIDTSRYDAEVEGRTLRLLDKKTGKVMHEFTLPDFSSYR